MKDPRQRTSREVELTVLDRSRRRCTLCFHFKNDLTEKHGQLAHLDHDPANSTEDNLAFLCLEHHSLFDSKSSQHKGYTIDEVKAGRVRLYEAIEQDRHCSSVPPLVIPTSSQQADRETFNQILAVLPSGGSIQFIRVVHFGGGFLRSKLDDLRTFDYDFAGPEHEFLDTGLEDLRAELRQAITVFLRLLFGNAEQLGRHDNPDPAFKIPQRHLIQDPNQWDQIVDAITTAAEAVVRAYDALIREARRRLL